MANGVSGSPTPFMFSDAPWYFRIIDRILTLSGISGLIAVGLTVFLCYTVWGSLNDIKRNQMVILKTQTDANVSMTTFAGRHEEIERERSRAIQIQTGILRQLCINAAKTELQQQGCTKEYGIKE